MFELSQEQIAKMSQDALKEIQEGLKDDIGKQIANGISYTVSREVSAVTEKFFKDEIVPSVQKALIDQKPIIIEAALASATELATVLATGMISSLTENMATSYKRKKIFDALFD